MALLVGILTHSFIWSLIAEFAGIILAVYLWVVTYKLDKKRNDWCILSGYTAGLLSFASLFAVPIGI